MKNFSAKFLLLAILITPCFCLAREAPTIVRQNFTPQFLIGESNLNFLGFKVYNIALWSEEKNFSYEKKFAIQILYNMNFTKEELAQKSVEEISRLHNLSEAQKIEYYAQFEKIFNNVKKGDEKIALFLPNSGVLLFHNNKLSGKISNLKLSRLFVDIWLDEKGSYPKVTKRILGKDN